MRSERIRQFATEESGGGTIMGLFWFVLLVGICGLAVDTTDGFRNRTMLQATADTSALAAAIDLPDQAAAKATAVTYSAANMGTDVNGAVLKAEDVTIGAWDEDTRTFTAASQVPFGTPLDAVYVMTKRTSENSNALPLNFLRILGLQTWNVRAQAIAERFIPECLYDGLIARRMVDISSNNSFTNHICVHGQRGVNIQSNNYFEEGVSVSMYDMGTLELPSSGLTSNIGLKDALREDSIDPRMVNHIDDILDAVLIKDTTAFPPIASVVPSDFELDAAGVNHIKAKDFDPTAMQSATIYHVICRPNQNLVLPEGLNLSGVVLIADCQLHIGANSTITNSFLASRSGGKAANGAFNRGDANITVAAGVQLGLPDNCASGGGTRLFSNATMNFSSSTGYDGVQLVAAGDIALGARDMGINGISAQSGGNIYMTSNNEFGLCSGNVDPILTSWYYRLVL
jgi:Flp pilus assembly protein TadG